MNHLGLFSGIGGFEEAFRRAGANLIGMCEIEPQARRVLRRHFAGVEIINDVKEITRETFAGRTIDIVTGGFPCQDLSVAGRRAGLAGARSGLWFEFIRIIGLYQPRWVVVENVPGLLSSNGGEDFAVILRGLVELGYRVAWRVFDSQFDGVAQRRERVFIVASLGNASCAEVLFEREGGAWDSAPSREAGQGIAAAVTTGAGKSCGPQNGNRHPMHLIAGTLSARASAGGGLGTDFECDGGLQPVAYRLRAFGDYEEDCKDATDLIVHPQVSHALTSEGADASEDGTGRGTPIIAYNIQQNDGGDHRRKDRPNGGFYVKETETALTVGSTDQTVVAQTLTAHQFRSNGATAGNNEQPVNLQVVPVREVAQSLTSNYGKQPDNSDTALGPNLAIAFTERTRAEGRNLETQDELAYALTNPGSGGRTHSRQIAGAFGVRRLTPRECERLQGYPDGWTERGDDGREISDSARYRMLGNAVCIPTVEWIARRIFNN